MIFISIILFFYEITLGQKLQYR